MPLKGSLGFSLQYPRTIAIDLETLIPLPILDGISLKSREMSRCLVYNVKNLQLLNESRPMYVHHYFLHVQSPETPSLMIYPGRPNPAP